jgi:putative sigma-54 modulation protein
VRTIVKGKNVEVPDRVRVYAERKLRRLERILDDRSDAIVELSNEQHRSAADAHIAEVTLVIDGQTLRSHAAGASYQAALDVVLDKVERQAVDHKEKPRLRAKPNEEKDILRKLADGTSDGPGAAVVKTKRFAIEPMFEEDAIARWRSSALVLRLRRRRERAPGGALPTQGRRLRPHRADPRRHYTPGRNGDGKKR